MSKNRDGAANAAAPSPTVNRGEGCVVAREMRVTTHEDGSLESVYYVQQGTDVRDGPEYVWYQGGAMLSEAFYVKGVQHGMYTRWRGPGLLEFRGEMRNGKPFGTWQAWDEDQNLKGTIYYTEGLDSGIYFTWHPNGMIAEAYQMASGRRVGRETSWHENGTIEREGTRDMEGNRIGVWREYSEQGHLLMEEDYSK